MRKLIKNNTVVPLLAALGVVAILAFVGCGDGGGHGAAPDPCVGPVPCLTEDWGTTYYEFVDQVGDPVVVISDGVVAGGGGIYYDAPGDPYPIALVGPVIDCYNGEVLFGAIDWNWNGIVDPGEELTSVEGKVNICGETLRVYDLVLEGIPYDDVVATYVGMGTLAEVDALRILPGSPDFLKHTLERFHEEEDK